MKIVIITQKEPFYLAKNIQYLIDEIKKNHVIVGAIITDVSPFGKRESLLFKSRKTLRIFGFKFFTYYSFLFLFSKLFTKSINSIFLKNQIPIIHIHGSINSEKNINKLYEVAPDLLISILGNQIFKKSILELAPKGCINLHTALLPKYRGLMPSFWVLKNNEEFTGVSVFFVDEGIDSGPIIVQQKVKIDNKTQQQLIRETKQIGMDLILKAINLIEKNKVQLIDNPDSEMSYYSFPTSKDVKEFKRLGKRFF